MAQQSIRILGFLAIAVLMQACFVLAQTTCPKQTPTNVNCPTTTDQQCTGVGAPCNADRQLVAVKMGNFDSTDSPNNVKVVTDPDTLIPCYTYYPCKYFTSTKTCRAITNGGAKTQNANPLKEVGC